jgi:hypothetical protein
MNSGEPTAKRDVAPAAKREVEPAAGADLAPVRCKNCDAVLLGRYCANCSQAADVHVPTTMELTHELLEGLTHSDSRLWRTLTTLWFKPGKLTAEFVAGRRVAYLPPFRLYLIVSIVFFLLLSLMHASGTLNKFDEATKPSAAPSALSAPAADGAVDATPKNSKPITSCNDLNFVASPSHPTWGPRITRACEGVMRDSDNYVHVALGILSKAMFLFLPLIAFFNMLMYWRPRYRYAEQLLFFVHLHAFFFSVGILIVALTNADTEWPKFAGVGGFLETLLGWTLPVYTLLAMRRVFPRSWLGTAIKGIALFFIYMIALALTVGASFLYAALQL